MLMKILFYCLATFFFSQFSLADNLELKIACQAAISNMPNGSGNPVYYPNGRTLTSSSGTPGVTWYYPNGRRLTSSISVPGATYYHSNGRTFSSNTGVEGAVWRYSNGRTITSSAPALSEIEMAELACDLIQSGEY